MEIYQIQNEQYVTQVGYYWRFLYSKHVSVWQGPYKELTGTQRAARSYARTVGAARTIELGQVSPQPNAKG